MTKEEVRETIKEMFRDGTIKIYPEYQNLQVKIEVWIDGECVEREEG